MKLNVRRRAARRRGCEGSVTTAGLVMFVLVILAVFSFAYDVGHQVLVKNQMQTAADAAALAGAYDLCLSGGNGNSTTSPATALTYSATANQDALAVATQNYVDGSLVSASEVGLFPCQYCTPAQSPSTGYSGNYFMTVTITKKVFNPFATLFGRGTDTLSVTSVAGPIGGSANPKTAIAPFPLAIYSPNGGVGNRTWTQQAGTNTLNVGLLPLLTNGSTFQFISGPTGLLGGTLATVGAGAVGKPTIEMMKYFDTTQTSATAPPSLTVGQTVMMMNPGVTGLNLTLLQAGPLTVENYFQTGNASGAGFLGVTAPAPSAVPSLAPFLQNKTFVVPVVTNPNVSILSMPLASTLKGGVAGQIVGFVPVRFTAARAKAGTGLVVLGIVVLPPDFLVDGGVQSGAAPMNVGLVM